MTTYRDDLEAAHLRTDKLEAELAQLRARNQQLDEQLAKDRERPAPVEQRSWLFRAMDWMDPGPRRDTTRTLIILIFAAMYIAAKESGHLVLAAIPLVAIFITPRAIAHYRKERSK